MIQIKYACTIPLPRYHCSSVSTTICNNFKATPIQHPITSISNNNTSLLIQHRTISTVPTNCSENVKRFHGIISQFGHFLNNVTSTSASCTSQYLIVSFPETTLHFQFSVAAYQSCPNVWFVIAKSLSRARDQLSHNETIG